MATKKIKIPATIDPARDRLATLDGIAIATGWERAAIVYAFTYDAPRGRPVNAQNGAFTVAGFATLKIKGLTSRNTIDLYRDAWKEAIAKGEAIDIQPGDTVTLPSIEFPPQERNQGSRPTPTNIGQQMANNPALLNAAVEAAATLAPDVVASQVAKPQVAANVVSNPATRKSVTRQQSVRTQRIVKQRQQAIQAAGADVKGQVNAAATAGPNLGAMSNSPEYTRLTSNRGQMINAWLQGIKEQSFNALDRQHMGADLPSLERFMEDYRAFVEAQDDPYQAVAQVREERNEQFQREMDEAEGDTTLNTDEIERFANEGA